MVLGFGYKKYQWGWWYKPLECRLAALELQRLCEYHQLKAWALEGTQIADSMGRGGGCTHTQPPSQFCHLFAKSGGENPMIQSLRLSLIAGYVLLTLWSFRSLHLALRCTHTHTHHMVRSLISSKSEELNLAV